LNLPHPEPSQTGADLTREEDDYTFYSKAPFHHLLRIERHRTERSGKPFLLLLLDISALRAERRPKEILDKLHSALRSALRETDIRGWYDHDRVIGVIFTEMTSVDRTSIERVFRKIHERLGEKLTKELLDKIAISFHVFPEQQGDVSIDGPFVAKLYPDLPKRDLGFRLSLAAKREMDVVLSAAALLLLSPLFLAIAAAIKWTSDGPVFFRQERLGCNGKRFTFLKFRSMYKDSDPGKHRDYILKYICEQQNAAVEPGVFKLKDDLRITPIGRWLRKKSLDELPQLINVLKGDMSLVGPRPPIPYECDLYDIWHRRRLLSCKPGITGLWQVMGRSRTTFDDMVRLDLKYINEWSLGLDLKILLKTPGAVFGGDGAY
jgi:lipopolysaccharide/colanic/teichoic acid biosynthesis glycosyltransferase